jgi:hypothetical protein
MYTLGQTVLAQGFAATFMSMTFRPKLFTEKAPMVPVIKAIAAKRQKDGVIAVEKSLDRWDMRNLRGRQIRGLCAPFFFMTRRAWDSTMPANFRGEFPSTRSAENLNSRQLG